MCLNQIGLLELIIILLAFYGVINITYIVVKKLIKRNKANSGIIKGYKG
jgi:uncharacterized membrane protein (Fun14 family)